MHFGRDFGAHFLKTYKLAIIALVVFCVSIIYYFIDPSQYRLMPKCPVKFLTTLDCPGCGFQRALHAALHGHFIEAIHYNLFLLLAIPLTCLWFINSFMIERTSNQVNRAKMVRLNRGIIYVYIFCYVCWFIIRNID